MSTHSHPDDQPEAHTAVRAEDSKPKTTADDGSNRFISTSSEWNFTVLERFDKEIGEIAHNEFNLDTYANQIEVISSEQMIDAYSSVGLPINYNHWSFGKQFVATEQTYRRGQMGLAYEIVINSDPCIAYLMEENTLPMQALVIAHASYGHNSFFKGNYLFRTWTNADAIIDYLVFARAYISECEERHGHEEVELLLDSCHALMNYGVDRYKRPSPLSMAEEKKRQHEREAYLQAQVNDLWRTLPVAPDAVTEEEERRFPSEPQENLLYFIEKNAPLLEPWQREVVRIVRKIGQYFYPQRQTQVMNEGWATFWHYTLLNRLYEKGLINDGFMIEILQSHTNVIYQPPFDSRHYSGINPYALGFAMMRDIRRICEQPTDEDRYWFPDFAGQDWIKVLDFAMRNFKDESFIAQYLSPHLMREFRLFAVRDDDRDDELEITAIHEEAGYRALRKALADQYNLGSREPNIQVYQVETRGDRSLTLRHYRYNRRPLEDDGAVEVLRHIRRLWGFDVRLEAVEEDGHTHLVAEV
ncbi:MULTISPECIES: SpoVR family protein [Thiorhodovibrio]|uniref:SpoVR family protein n=1 Tax=Thiorhodovibrio TaxID=61593 RepID=UPI001F5C75B7|nr:MULTISPECIES: SpoVR family protein [Thiorhodovibrio]WPL13299.1 SpoVR family protein [Thiorhodovibrio litoralis]